MGAPNLLILDEPTNDFDVETLAALEDLLDGFAGTLLIVSHDRYFLERVCDDFMALMGDQRLRELTGGIETYLQLRAQQIAAAGVDDPVPSAQPKSSSAQERENRKAMARLERQIDQLRKEEDDLHVRLAEHATDYSRIAELDSVLRDVTARRSMLEEQWLELGLASD